MSRRKLTTPKYAVGKSQERVRHIRSNVNVECIDLRGYRKNGVIVAGKKTEKEKLRVEVDTTKNQVGYMIMALNDAVSEYGISINEGLMLMYLFEIGGFGLHIKTNSKRVSIGDYEKMGYIELVYEEENIYQLSKLGKEIVFFIYDRIKDPSQYLKYLDKSQKESTNEVSKVIGKYYS